MASRRAVVLLLVLVILAQTACADVAIDFFSKKFSEWAVDQFGAVPMIIVGVILLIIAIVWGVVVRKRRSQNKR